MNITEVNIPSQGFPNASVLFLYRNTFYFSESSGCTWTVLPKNTVFIYEIIYYWDILW